MKKIILVIVINVVLIGGQLVLAIGRSADGVSVSALNAKFNEVQEENARLANQVYTRSSLVYVASQAAQLGLVSGSVGWLNGPVSVAVARLTP